MGETEIAASAIGQGKVEVTPLNMLMVASTVANKGEMISPSIVKNVISKDGKIKNKTQKNVIGNPIGIAMSEEIKEYMVSVVEEGTGKAAAISGVSVAGKTGTAENKSENSHAWFMGFAPADEPKVSVVVLLEEEGSTGGTSAAPIAREIMQYAINNINN